MSAFDFTGDYPVRETIYDPGKEVLEAMDEAADFEFRQGFDAKVDYWMNVRGFTREEAEQRVLSDMLDDGA